MVDDVSAFTGRGRGVMLVPEHEQKSMCATHARAMVEVLTQAWPNSPLGSLVGDEPPGGLGPQDPR